MQRNPRAFTVVEIVVVIVIAVLLVGILLPSLGTHRRPARQMQSNTQVRGIQSALVLYAAGNNTYYPGLDSQGDEASLGGGTDNGYETDERLEELLRDAYFTGEYVISPGEVKTAWTSGDLLTSNYSYALLGILDKAERVEWKDTINTEALVVSDRVATASSSEDLTSVWTTEPGDWRGSLAWNDNHVAFEMNHQGFTTKYGEDINKASDDIFIDDHADSGDAIMVFADDGRVFP